MNICKVEGCSKPVHSIGLCQPHYRQERRRQRGLSAPGPKPDPSKPRSRYRDSTSCRSGHLYVEGSFSEDARGHRVCLVCAEERKKTHCPQGHPYDEENTYVANGSRQCKTCRRERMRSRRPRSVGQGGVNAAKTHCPQGHEYSAENTYWTPDGRRMCRTCSRSKAQGQNVRRYGLTVEQYRDLHAEQGGRCASCRDPIRLGVRQAHIDHDHTCCDGPYSCGKCVRGLLCSSCNQGIGYFHDDPARLRAAADYIERYR